MNEVFERVEPIKQRLRQILKRTGGNFSIEQHLLKDGQINAVLLKIYQQSTAKEGPYLTLVIDEGLNIGVVSRKQLNGGVNPMCYRRPYSYNTQTFAPWVKEKVAEKLSA